MAKRRKRSVAGRARGKRHRKRKNSLSFSAIVVLTLLGVVSWWGGHNPQLQQRYQQGQALVVSYLQQVGARWQQSHQPQLPASDDQLQASLRADSPIFAGIPLATFYPHPITVLENEGFFVGYCDTKKNPIWVSYRVFPVDVARGPPRLSSFKTDTRTAARVSPSHYTNSGYDRGHMAPNYAIATRYGKTAQQQSFQMSNIAPQLPRLNRGLWRQLEERIANRWSSRYASIWVLVGPIFADPDHLGKPFEHPVQRLAYGIARPTAFYQIIIAEDQGTLQSMAFIIPQNITGNESLESFLTTIDTIEERTGLNFFHQLDARTETELEARRSQYLWN